MARVYAAMIAAVLLAVASFWAGWEWRDRSADLAESQARTVAAEAQASAVQAARAVEQSQAAALAKIGDAHEEARAASATVPDSVVADLRGGVLQLRDDLARCETSRLSAGVAAAVERDAHAELRAEVAGALVQVGRDADEHVRACHAVIHAYLTGGEL